MSASPTFFMAELLFQKQKMLTFALHTPPFLSEENKFLWFKIRNLQLKTSIRKMSSEIILISVISIYRKFSQ